MRSIRDRKVRCLSYLMNSKIYILFLTEYLTAYDSPWIIIYCFINFVMANIHSVEPLIFLSNLNSKKFKFFELELGLSKIDRTQTWTQIKIDRVCNPATKYFSGKNCIVLFKPSLSIIVVTSLEIPPPLNWNSWLRFCSYTFNTVLQIYK